MTRISLLAVTFLAATAGQTFSQHNGGDSTPVESQITDSITRANAKVVGDAPATATGQLYLETSNALATPAQDGATTIPSGQ